MPQPDMTQAEIKALVEKNKELLEENNKLLKKIHRGNVINTWLRIVWYILLIGLPFALYFYVLEPYFEALGSSYETFYMGIQEVPGFKQFNEALRNYQGQ